MKAKEIHIDLVRAGDAVVHNGKEMTVSAHNIKRGGFMGTTLFGDSYRFGTKPVTLVLY